MWGPWSGAPLDPRQGRRCLQLAGRESLPIAEVPFLRALPSPSSRPARAPAMALCRRSPCPLRTLLFARACSPSLLLCRGRRAPARSSRPASPCCVLLSSQHTRSLLFRCLPRARKFSARNGVSSFRVELLSCVLVVVSELILSCHSILVIPATSVAVKSSESFNSPITSWPVIDFLFAMVQHRC
jgi:hypothetical protein